MYRRLHLRRVLAPLIGLVLLHPPADAREIYKWVAQDGTTQYGEVLPDAAIGGFEVLEVLPAPPPPPSAVGDYRAILELADKLEAARLARERLRLERERLSLQQRRAQFDQFGVALAERVQPADREVGTERGGLPRVDEHAPAAPNRQPGGDARREPPVGDADPGDAGRGRRGRPGSIGDQAISESAIAAEVTRRPT